MKFQMGVGSGASRRFPLPKFCYFLGFTDGGVVTTAHCRKANFAIWEVLHDDDDDAPRFPWSQ